VNVVDTTPPTIVCPANIVVECTGPGGTIVNYPPPIVNDACSVPTVVCVPPPGSTFPDGVTIVTCTATDGVGNLTQCQFTVTVQDTTPPDLFINVARTILWFPLNGLADVGLTVFAFDVCDPVVEKRVTVYSDEVAGAIAPDAAVIGVTPNQRLQLRAERELVFNSGRFYIVVVDAIDDAGNRRRDCRTVVVPFNLTTSAITTWQALVPPLLPTIPCPAVDPAPSAGPNPPPGHATILNNASFNN
jgi:hypothetical protein